VLNPNPIQRGTSHLYDRVADRFDEILEKVDVSETEKAQGGYKIFTTIDKDVQRQMEREIQNKLLDVERRDGYEHTKYQDYVRTEDSKPAYLQAAGMMMDNETGEIIAYVGGRNFEHSQYDFIQSGKKPLGTAFFPFIYAAALENELTNATQLIDEAMDNRQVMIDGVEGILGEWGHEVRSPEYEGLVSLRRALMTSKIAATVRLGRMVGLDTVWNISEKFGLRKPEGRLLNRTLLGSESAAITELVKAYSVFPNGGKMVGDLVWISKIEDASGRVVYEWKPSDDVKEIRVIEHSTAFLIGNILEDTIKHGSGSDVYKASNMKGFRGGGKTGTTSDFSDHWYVGYNGIVTCALWSGFYDGSRKEIYPEAFSKETVMPVWLEVMRKAKQKLGDRDISPPENIVKLRVCSKSGMLESQSCEEHEHDVEFGKSNYVSTGYEEYFHVDNQPRSLCPVHGVDLGDFHANFNDGQSELSAIERLNTIPIQPKSLTLIGEDPYNALIPSSGGSRYRSIYRAGRGLGSMDFDFLEKENSESEIKLAKPSRLVITD